MAPKSGSWRKCRHPFIGEWILLSDTNVRLKTPNQIPAVRCTHGGSLFKVPKCKWVLEYKHHAPYQPKPFNSMWLPKENGKGMFPWKQTQRPWWGKKHIQWLQGPRQIYHALYFWNIRELESLYSPDCRARPQVQKHRVWGNAIHTKMRGKWTELNLWVHFLNKNVSVQKKHVNLCTQMRMWSKLGNWERGKHGVLRKNILWTISNYHQHLHPTSINHNSIQPIH